MSNSRFNIGSNITSVRVEQMDTFQYSMVQRFDAQHINKRHPSPVLNLSLTIANHLKQTKFGQDPGTVGLTGHIFNTTFDTLVNKGRSRY